MGDREIVVAQTSSVMEFSSSGYTSTEYSAVSSNVTSDGVSFTTGAAVDATTSTIPTDTAYPLSEIPSLADGNAYDTHPSYDTQEPPVTSANESKPVIGVENTSENLISQENVVPDSAQVVSYDSSANGNGVSEMRNFTHTGRVENGSASNDAGGAAEQLFEEGSALSAEAERLWSIVKANSLDFNAWTALIEETEKVAEVC
ncbi:uncharacterized protein LOC122080164 [Macadamia integrifolia]|uniref:uncharacterized protein LOC122080164 n=1 Tax=Macadamia integrifolia TaxID=60698 RepID=UPI001C4E342D|nr:uncharacterized protein LOC122080164 [Macadamia integrifolia]XP_042503003.1 uncharacterized protein LOC122080164 [Macadamia integrifolia]